jgi:hypothetical protein
MTLQAQIAVTKTQFSIGVKLVAGPKRFWTQAILRGVAAPSICLGAFGCRRAHVIDIPAGEARAWNSRVVAIVVAGSHAAFPMPADAGSGESRL